MVQCSQSWCNVPFLRLLCNDVIVRVEEHAIQQNLLKSPEMCIYNSFLHVQTFERGQRSYTKRDTLPESFKSGGNSGVPSGYAMYSVNTLGCEKKILLFYDIVYVIQ